LEHDFVLKIQTTPDSTPLKVLQEEINNLITEITGLMRNFQDELTLKNMEGGF
jgi:DNA-directed RNA polymerase subunit L